METRLNITLCRKASLEDPTRTIVGAKKKKKVTSICAYCARMKRGVMSATMRKCNANKLVLAQHLDDAAESTMRSFMHNGFLRTTKAHYTMKHRLPTSRWRIIFQSSMKIVPRASRSRKNKKTPRPRRRSFS